MPRLRIVFLLFLGLLSPGIGLCQSDEVRWVRHIESLLDVAVHTENDPKFLDWAEVYCDSLKQKEGFETLAAEQQARINQTRDICGDNLNHRAPTLELFRGKPHYMGFADDAVEYALESAMLNLLRRPIEFQSTTSVRDGALHAVVAQGAVELDLWEIALDALDVETNYSFQRMMGIPKSAEDSLIWHVQKVPSEANLRALAEGLKVKRIAVFEVEVSDVIEERLWLVGMRLRVWDVSNGFGDTISATGFCEDKTASPIMLNLLDVLVWSFLLLILISGLEHIHWSEVKRGVSGLKGLLLILSSWIRLAIERIPKIALFLVLPTVVSFLFLQAVGAFVPVPTTHYQELDSKLWVIGTAMGMSLLPTVLNFFVLNRIRLDGFHSMRSYRDLANVSLFGSFIPFMYIHEVNGTPLGFEFVLMLVVATWMAADLLAFNFNEIIAAKKSPRVRLVAVGGLVLGIVVVMVLTFDMIGESSLQASLQLSLLGGLANIAYRPLMRRAHNADLLASRATSDSSSLETGEFVGSVVPNIDEMLGRIQSDAFKTGFIRGPKGIGKTRLVQEIQLRLKESDASWSLFFGDCDEIQEEGHLAFEPFVEAFGDFLSITEVGDRTAQFDSIGQSVFSAVAEAAPIPLGFEGVEENVTQSLEDFALYLIDRLEKIQGKSLLILDDAQWMDVDTQQLLEKFMGMVSRNANLRGRLKLILTCREAENQTVNRLNAFDFISLASTLDAIDLFDGTKFETENFLMGLSQSRADFTLSDNSLNTLNDLFNHRLSADSKDEEQVVTPLYIIRTISQFQSNQTLVSGSDGWVLSRTLNLDDLPNSEAIDAFYHKIFDTYPAKWVRVLESASIVGRSFDATVLAAVWGHELLDVLDYLEQLESQEILEDVRNEDNIYKFKDKRAIAAVRSYFPNSSGDRNARQIVVEYNKRLLSASASCVPERALQSDQALWSYLERLGQVQGAKGRRSSMHLLIEELAIRFALDAEDHGAAPLIKLESKASEWGFTSLTRLLQALIVVLGEDSLRASQFVAAQKSAEDALTPHLRPYIRLLFDRNHALNLLNGETLMLEDREREEIATQIIQAGQGAAWVGVVALLLAHPKATVEFKKSLTDEWKECPPLLNGQMSFAKKRFELIAETGLSSSEKTEEWFLHWSEVVSSGSMRQRKVVAKAILRRLLNVEENIKSAVQWFFDNQHHLRSNSGALRLGWIQTLNGVLLNDVYARRMLCQENKSLLQEWFRDMDRYLELRFDPDLYSQAIFDMRARRLSCEMEWNDFKREDLQKQGEAMVHYVKGFQDVHTIHLATAFKVAAAASLPKTAFEFLKAEYEIYISINNEMPQAESLDGVCVRLSTLCRNELNDYESALRWARESLSWAEKALEQGRDLDIGPNHYFVGTALVELDLHQEAAEAFQQALDQWSSDSDGMKYKIAITNMHRGASQIKAGMPEGKQTLQEAIDALESQELKPLVSNTNASRIEEMKQLLD